MRQYSPEEVIKILEHIGWSRRPSRRRRGRGSHLVFIKPGNPNNISIVTSHRMIPRGEMAAIIRMTGLTRSQWDKIADEVL